MNGEYQAVTVAPLGRIETDWLSHRAALRHVFLEQYAATRLADPVITIATLGKAVAPMAQVGLRTQLPKKAGFDGYVHSIVERDLPPLNAGERAMIAITENQEENDLRGLYQSVDRAEKMMMLGDLPLIFPEGEYALL